MGNYLRALHITPHNVALITMYVRLLNAISSNTKSKWWINTRTIEVQDKEVSLMKENNKGLLGKCHVMKYQDVLTGKLTSAGEGGRKRWKIGNESYLHHQGMSERTRGVKARGRLIRPAYPWLLFSIYLARALETVSLFIWRDTLSAISTVASMTSIIESHGRAHHSVQ